MSIKFEFPGGGFRLRCNSCGRESQKMYSEPEVRCLIKHEHWKAHKNEQGRNEHYCRECARKKFEPERKYMTYRVQ